MKTSLLLFAPIATVGGFRLGHRPASSDVGGRVRVLHRMSLRPDGDGDGDCDCDCDCTDDDDDDYYYREKNAASRLLLLLRRGGDDDRENVAGSNSRRSLFHSAGLAIAGTVSSGPFYSFLKLGAVGGAPSNNVDEANAMGLVQFPCKPGTLFNTYHMMRAGESCLEAEGVLSTNPLFLTNREDALTELGTMQVEEACQGMMSRGINPSVVKYSLASKCIDSANIVATTMMVGRNRIVPEFTFMDPRGAGLWDGKPLAATEAAIWAMDVAEAGNEGRDGRPPQNDDGTASETLFDQVIRLRQLMSVLETQYSGDSILLVFPDGTSPALLSCLIAGIPLKNAHALNFTPGELREGVDMNNARELLKEKISSRSYEEALSVGRVELEKLRREERDELEAIRMEKESRALERERRQEALMTTTKPRQSREPTTRTAQRRAIDTDDGNIKVVNFGDSLYPVGAMGAIASMVMWRGDDDEGLDEISSKSTPKVAPVLAYANSTGSSVFERQAVASPSTLSKETDTARNIAATTVASPVQAYANSTGSSVIEQRATGPSTTTLDSPSETVQKMVTPIMLAPNVFEDVPVLSNQERIEAAERAMDEYLSQDDGGDDWLSSMQDMMNEE